MTIVIVIAVTLVLVIGLGVLIFSLMRRTPKVVPNPADRTGAAGERVVAVDDQGRRVLARDEEPPAPHDDAAFEDVLKDELKDLRG